MNPELSSTTRTIIENIKYKRSWHLLLLTLVPLFLYLKVLSYGFVYDDLLIIKNNLPTLQHFSNWMEAFRRDAFFNNAGELLFYRPLQILSFMLDASISGDNPLGYHFTNLLLHLLTCITLYTFLRKQSIDIFTAFMFSFLYSVHPVLAPGVSWIPSRGDMLIGLFSLLSVLSLQSYLQSGKVVYGFIHATVFVLAILSKETAIFLPFLLVLYWISFYKHRFTFSRVFPFLVFWAIIIEIFLWLRSSVLTTTLPPSVLGLPAFISNLPILPVMFEKLFFPYGLPLYPPFTSVSMVIGLLLLILVFLWGVRLLKENNVGAIWGILWLVVFILPPLIFRHRSFDVMIVNIEQRLCIPTIGLIIFLSFALNKRIQKHQNKFLVAAAVLGLLFAVLAYQHSSDYKNGFTYCNAAIAKNPRNACAYTYRGFSYFSEANDIGSALHDFNKAIEICGFSKAYFDRGILELLMKYYQAAAQDFTSALAQDSTMTLCYVNRATAEVGMNNIPAAFHDFSIIERLEPNNPTLYLNRGKLYRSLMKNDSALVEFNKCILLNQSIKEAYANRAEVTAALGDIAGSIQDYKILLQFNPVDIPVLTSLARLQRAAQQPNESIATYTTILQIDPYKADAYYERGLVKLNSHDETNGKADIQKSSELGFPPAVALLKELYK